jgi:flavin-binding protein dodecin
VKAAKNLAETFRAHDGDRITTVAAAKAAVRKPAETQVELEWNRTLEASKRWQDQDRYNEFIARLEHRLEMERADAAQLGLILAAREAIVPGTGWSRDEQDKAFTTALKRARKAWFR